MAPLNNTCVSRSQQYAIEKLLAEETREEIAARGGLQNRTLKK